MEAAILACKSGMSMNKAAKQFNVTYTTLYHRLHGERLGKRGRKRMYSTEEEQFIAKFLLKAAAKKGFRKSHFSKILQTHHESVSKTSTCSRKLQTVFLKISGQY